MSAWRWACFVWAIAACWVIAACRTSPPVQFFTLTAVVPDHASGAEGLVPIQVAAIHVPPSLDRQEMVSESTATQLTVSDQHRWGAPFGDILRRVLTQDLADRLPPGAVLYADEPAPAHVHEVVVDILRFVAEPGGQVVFDGSWSIVSATGDTVVASRHLRLRQPAPPGDYRQQTLAMSRLVGMLADTVARAVVSAANP
ncbi:MAG TPA: PqiC family protein [Gemmatimonadaceae bacterium]|nr:PqiC family protein [Gemmatimonadaceae bacterium]